MGLPWFSSKSQSKEKLDSEMATAISEKWHSCSLIYRAGSNLNSISNICAPTTHVKIRSIPEALLQFRELDVQFRRRQGSRLCVSLGHLETHRGNVDTETNTGECSLHWCLLMKAHNHKVREIWLFGSPQDSLKKKKKNHDEQSIIKSS